MSDKVKTSRRGLALWMTDPDFEDIDFGVTPPRSPIIAPRPTDQGGWVTNPVIKKPKGPKKPKKPNDPNKFAR